MVFAHVSGEVHAVGSRHAEVGDHQVVGSLLEKRDGSDNPACNGYPAAVIREDALDDLELRRVIIDDENAQTIR